MTEKIKDKMTGWLVGFIVILLGWIAGGVGYLIVQNDSRIETNHQKIEVIEGQIQDLYNISRNLVGAYTEKSTKDKEQDKEILELWKCAKRSGTAPDLTEWRKD